MADIIQIAQLTRDDVIGLPLDLEKFMSHKIGIRNEYSSQKYLQDENPINQIVKTEESEKPSTADHLIRSLESQIEDLTGLLQSKELEIETLLNEIGKYKDESGVLDPEAAHITEQYEQFIESLNEKNQELEERIEYLVYSNDKHIQAIEKMELENEALRAEIEKLNIEIKKLSRDQHATQPMRRDDRRCFSQLFEYFPPREPSTQSSILLDSSKLFEEQCKNEEAWFSQIEELKEKLETEKSKVRDLEFLIMNMKNSNQRLAADNFKLNEDKRQLETKFGYFKDEYDKMNEIRMQERLKIDSLVAFCNLLENYGCSCEESTSQIADLPRLIINYLNGSIQTLNFNSRKYSDWDIPRNNSRAKSQKVKHNESLAQEIQNIDIYSVQQSIKEVKEEMNKMLQTMNKNTQDGNSRTIDWSSRKKMDLFQEDLCVAQEKKHPPKLLKPTKFFLSQAIAHSNSLLWSLKRPPVVILDNEGSLSDESDISDS